jgi:tetratricopeptide (TPR) repeat protein
MKSDGYGVSYQLFQRAGHIFPGEAAIWHNIGKLHHELNDNDKADEYFRKALKVQPNFANSLEGLGMTHLNRAEFGMAIDYCNRALAEDPDATEARSNRGMAYLALKRWSEGWRDYNANVGKDKNRGTAPRGRMWWCLGSRVSETRSASPRVFLTWYAIQSP